MRLYILRHAAAEMADEKRPDEARRLTDRGCEDMRKAATGMQRMGLVFEALLTSPLVRAAETAAIVAAIYQNHPMPQPLDVLATGVPAVDAMAALRSYSRYTAVMIVGHEPQLSTLASLLLTGSSDAASIRLRKGGCLALEVPGRVGSGRAELLWMMTPRQLRSLRK